MVILHAPSVIIGVLIFGIGWILAAFARNTIIKVSKKTHRGETAAIFLSHVAYVGIMIVVVLTALSQAGIPITPISSMLAGILVGISMSLKSSVGNLSSGIVIALFKPFKIGEFVDMGSDTMGTVESIELFFSKLRTTDGREITVPNNLVMSKPITNFSNNEFRRNDFIIGIGYKDNLQQAKDILQSLVDQDGRILKIEGKLPMIRTNELGANTVNILVRYWTIRADFIETKWSMTEKTKLALDEANINIPYPQRDVHIHQTAN